VRFVQQDLNFLALQPRTYDAILVTNAVSRVVNLEFFFDEVAQAMKPGGVVGAQFYAGERRQVYAPARLALVNDVLRQLPLRFRFDDRGEITPADPADGPPFRAVRSDEIAAVAKARFDVVDERYGGRLFPLFIRLDVTAMEREAPHLLEQICQRERELERDPAAPPCSAFLILRPRAAAGGAV
jgi:SAM-dependent methyltransferase